MTSCGARTILPPQDQGERSVSRRQCEVFRELIEGCVRAGAGNLTPLCGGVRYLSADGAVTVTITDRRWL
jgi:hypothetical protein